VNLNPKLGWWLMEILATVVFAICTEDGRRPIRVLLADATIHSQTKKEASVWEKSL
jgi:hypothetical protein